MTSPNKTFGRSIGGLEYAVLSAIQSLKEGAYGTRVWTTVEERLGRSISVGAVYTTLDRLQKKGFISSWRGEPTAVRGGRAKRYFRIEAAGVRAVIEFDRGVDSVRQDRPVWEPA